MSIIDDLRNRGLIAHISDEVGFEEQLKKSKLGVYCGFDPTAESLHIGNLLMLVLLKRFSDAGCSVVALVGGATGLVGDPSGKIKERLLSEADIVQKRVDSLKDQISNILKIERDSIVNNIEWMGDMTMLSFLREVGKHFSVNAMLLKDSVKKRIESNEEGISYTEFSYMLLQAYDFLRLYKSKGCVLQIGGSDQWGNISNGITLIRRVLAEQALGLTVPLIEKSDGSKFGKTESGTVWLDASMTSPYVFYQFWMNISDSDAFKWIYAFSFEELSVIEKKVEEMKREPESRILQKSLAQEMTSFVHGVDALESVERISGVLFGKSCFEDLQEGDFQQLMLDGIPCTEVKVGETDLGDLLVEIGFGKSKGQIRRLIDSKGIELSGEKIRSIEDSLESYPVYFDKFQILRRGKKMYSLLYWK